MTELSDYRRLVSDPLEDTLRKRIADLSTCLLASEAETAKAVERAERAAIACEWAEKALERYSDALGLEVDEAALIAWAKCGEVVREAKVDA